MAISIKIQKDHYLTEATVVMPADVKEVDDLLKATKTTGRMIVLYNQGGVIGINFEQKTKLNEAQASELREKIGVGEEIID